MIGHYVATFCRSLNRQRLYAAINVAGLALGVAVFLILSLIVRFETSFERWIPAAPQIYAVRSNILNQGWLNYTLGDLLDELRADYPRIIGARVRTEPGAVRRNGAITAERVTQVDPSFFTVFDLPLVAGDRGELLRSPDEAVISEALAKKYFGESSPLGERLTVNHRGRTDVYRVVGVTRTALRTTDLKLDILVPLAIPTPDQDPRWRRWGALDATTYLRFKTHAEAEALDAELDRFTDRHAPKPPHGPAHKLIAMRLAPLLAMHLIAPHAGAMVAATGIVGLLTLLLAAVNYVNLATARAGIRAREVAMRKVLGATQLGLILQFTGEAVATAALSVLVGLALCELALPWLNATLGLELKLDYLGDPWLGGTVLAVITIVGVGAGLYPALVLSNFQPASVLASSQAPGGGRMGARLREGLVTLQFCIAIAFTIGTAVIVSQSAYLHKVDLGFQRTGLIEVNSFPHPDVSLTQQASLLAAWRGSPGIISATQSDSAPGDPDIPVARLKRPGSSGDGSLIYGATIGPDFFETYGARRMAGRFPDLQHGADFQTPPASPPNAQVGAGPMRRDINIVLNTQALHALGFRRPQDAIGKSLVSGKPHDQQRLTVIGVIADLRFTSPREPVEPILYLPSGDRIGGSMAVVRYSGSDPDAVLAQMNAIWRRIVPTEPFAAKTMVAELAPYYQADDQVSRLLTIAAVLAVAIACFGLYGLASFNTQRRVREVGIRKALGASASDILKLFIGQFTLPVLLANLVAWPLAYLAMRAYLSGFNQRISLGPRYFLAATVLTLLIALATVASQAWSIARAEPAKALRRD